MTWKHLLRRNPTEGRYVFDMHAAGTGTDVRWMTEVTGARYKPGFYTADNLRAVSERRPHQSIPSTSIMNPTFKLPLRLVAVAVGLTCGVSAKAVTFETENISGNFDSTISLGLGVRASTPTCGLVFGRRHRAQAPTGCLDPISGLGDQGNLNYARGDLFAGQLKGSHELLLKLPRRT